ncbi:hypothetical protein NHQ30_008876 [Ciborinia camelliae]|nr:hypothetical protein NHQ30_008876 [Ciborinia camelliae]
MAYVEPLRQEAHNHPQEDLALHGHGRPLLESFLKESARYTSVDASKFLGSLTPEYVFCADSKLVSCRRKALSPFTFSDGLQVLVGDWVCIPQRAMGFDSGNYKCPETFDGFRFANDELEKSSASNQFTETSPSWLMWGLGKTAW